MMKRSIGISISELVLWFVITWLMYSQTIFVEMLAITAILGLHQISLIVIAYQSGNWSVLLQVMVNAFLVFWCTFYCVHACVANLNNTSVVIIIIQKSRLITFLFVTEWTECMLFYCKSNRLYKCSNRLCKGKGSLVSKWPVIKANEYFHVIYEVTN